MTLGAFLLVICGALLVAFYLWIDGLLQGPEWDVHDVGSPRFVFISDVGSPRFVFISIAVWALIWFAIALFIIHS